MPHGTENNPQARPGLILGLGAVVVLTLVLAFLLKPASSDSGRSSEGSTTSDTSVSDASSDAQKNGASGMRLIQKSGQETTMSPTLKMILKKHVGKRLNWIKPLKNP